DDFSPRGCRHESPDPRTDLDEALGLQLLEHLAHRGAAHTELFGDGMLGDVHSGRDLGGNDAPTNLRAQVWLRTSHAFPRSASKWPGSGVSPAEAGPRHRRTDRRRRPWRRRSPTAAHNAVTEQVARNWMLPDRSASSMTGRFIPAAPGYGPGDRLAVRFGVG